MDPVLYILMRTDMDSLNPGKAMAQAAHAQALFSLAIDLSYNVDMEPPNSILVVKLYNRWRNQTPQGFGTTIVLAVSDGEYMKCVIDQVRQFDNVCTGIVTDPTYPVRDGKVIHHISVDTCAYVFGDRSQGLGPLESLRPHP